MKKNKKEKIQINPGLIEKKKETKQTNRNCYVLFQVSKKKHYDLKGNTFLPRTVSFIFFQPTTIMAMRQYPANIPPPGKMGLVGNVANNWQTFKCNSFYYLIVSRYSKEADTEYQTSLSLATTGQDVFDIYDGLEFNNEDKMDLEIVMKELEAFFIGETHKAFESYKFHRLKQEPTENIETYIGTLRQFAKPVILASYETD